MSESLTPTQSEAQNILDEIDAEKQDLIAKNDALRETIRPALEKNGRALDSLEKKKEKLIAPLLEERGLEGLMTDADFAAMVYRADWNSGRGMQKVSDALEAAFSQTSYMTGKRRIVSRTDEAFAISGFQFAIPRGADIQKLDELAEVSGKLYAIQQKIAEGTDLEGKVSVHVLTDDCGESGVRSVSLNSKGAWECRVLTYGSSRVESEHQNLWDAVSFVAENWTYGATDEYERQNPGWDEDDEDYGW